MNLYLYHNNEQSGPFPLEAVQEMVRLGTVPETALAWYEGAPEWMPLTTFLPKQEAAATPPRTRMGRPLVPAAKPVDTSSFYERLPGAIAYPFRRNGIILLLTGTVFFWLLGIGQRFVFLFSLVLGVISGGYLFAYMQAIIQSSAQGDDEMPPWPDFADWVQDIIQPFFRFVGILAVCLGPGLLTLLYAGVTEVGGSPAPAGLALGVALLVVGGLYLPMGLLAVSMADGLAGLNPLFVIPSILRVPGQYVVACVVLGAVVALDALIEPLVAKLLPIPLLFSLLQAFLSLYFLTLEMRILGLLYYTNRGNLRWF